MVKPASDRGLSRSDQNDRGNIADVNVGSAEMYPCQKLGSRQLAAYNARLTFLTPRAASQRLQRVRPKTGLHVPNTCGHRCRAAGRRRDAHRLSRSRKLFASNGIRHPLSLPAHEKTPRSLATCDRRVLVVGDQRFSNSCGTLAVGQKACQIMR